MASAFDLYADYYDLLNAEKDYAAEADFVLKRLAPNADSITSLLELGCGTGRHGLEFANRGLSVTGIDLSPAMVAIGQARTAAAAGAGALQVEVGDVRTFRANRKFDAIASLFHVVSYQTSTEDLVATFRTAASHLRSGSPFLFDFWYGPAVLSVRPATRVRRMENDKVAVLRVAEPELLSHLNTVNVRYSIYVKDKRTNALRSFTEEHALRYLFLPELDALLADAGFVVADRCEWLTGAPLDLQTWGATLVAVRR